MRIIQHCLVYFLSDSCPEIQIFDNQARLSLNQIFKERFSTDENKDSFTLGNNKFELLNIKINDRAFHHKSLVSDPFMVRSLTRLFLAPLYLFLAISFRLLF